MHSVVDDAAMKKYMSVESLKPTANLAVDTECKTLQLFLLLIDILLLSKCEVCDFVDIFKAMRL